MCGLKDLFAKYELSQRAVAAATGVSPAAMNKLVNQGLPPKRGWEALQQTLSVHLAGKGVPETLVAQALKHLTPSEEDYDMIMRKQTLDMRTRQAFGLVRNPFADPQDAAEVYLSPESRYVREIMYDAATNHGFLAVVGESGSGKSTLKEELTGRIADESRQIIFIEPYTLAMADSEKNGKPLRSQHIAEAIISTVAPGTAVPQSPEMRFRKLHSVLIASNDAGFAHCLIIEEAHDLHQHTLKSLKRFWELKKGLTRLLSIMLIGQTELGTKLHTAGAAVREVVQRCDVVHLRPIQNIGDFLHFRFERAGADFERLFTPDAVQTLEERLTTARDNSGRGVSMYYPLAVSNLAIAAMNLAANVGETLVTADVVRQVQP